ncbi:MAG: DUF190 domain-containing protein [Paludibacter sp.]
MSFSEKSTLKICACSTDKIGNNLLYEHLVSLANKQGITGTAVYRGIRDFEKSSIFHWFCFWKRTEKCPVIIEMIDKTEVLESFFKTIETELRQMPNGCLVTITPVVVNHKNGNKANL